MSHRRHPRNVHLQDLSTLRLEWKQPRLGDQLPMGDDILREPDKWKRPSVAVVPDLHLSRKWNGRPKSPT